MEQMLSSGVPWQQGTLEEEVPWKQGALQENIEKSYVCGEKKNRNSNPKSTQI
jgi:hypothetical protein